LRAISGRLLCPSCQEVLVPVDRDGVEIDYCPNCRGVWLDRGELDKVIERASLRAPRGTQAPPPQYYDDDDDDYRHRKRKRRKSFLEELFDFD